MSINVIKEFRELLKSVDDSLTREEKVKIATDAVTKVIDLSSKDTDPLEIADKVLHQIDDSIPAEVKKFAGYGAASILAERLEEFFEDKESKVGLTILNIGRNILKIRDIPG